MHALVQCASSTWEHSPTRKDHAEKRESSQPDKLLPCHDDHRHTQHKTAAKGLQHKVTWVSTQGAPGCWGISYVRGEQRCMRSTAAPPLLARQAEDVERLGLLAPFWF